jgi:hypothetical protein
MVEALCFLVHNRGQNAAVLSCITSVVNEFTQLQTKHERVQIGVSVREADLIGTDRCVRDACQLAAAESC